MRLQSGGSNPKGLFTHLSGNCAEKGGGWSLGSRGGDLQTSLCISICFLHIASPAGGSMDFLHGGSRLRVCRTLKREQSMSQCHHLYVSLGSSAAWLSSLLSLGSCHKELLKVMVRRNRFNLLMGERKLTCRNRDISVVIFRMSTTAASNIFLNGSVCRGSARETSTGKQCWGIVKDW